MVAELEGTATVTEAYERYFDRLHELLAEVRAQGDRIEAAAGMIAACIGAGGIVHVFGSGHSHMMAEEVFHRAGGLFAFNAMLDVNLTHFGTLKAGMVERTEGYAPVILDSFDVRPHEVVIIVSNSGINPVPIELAIEAGKRDAKTIGITSAANYAGAKSRHSSGKTGGRRRPLRRQPGPGRRCDARPSMISTRRWRRPRPYSAPP